MAHKLSERERRTYRALRADGYGAADAVRTIRYAQHVRAWIDTLGAREARATGYGEAWDVTGPHGLEYRVTFEPDEYAGRPEDNGDCYSAEYIDAWERDRWHYYYVGVTVLGGLGQDGLGGVDAGDYFQRHNLMDTTEQLWAVVLEHGMLENAHADMVGTMTRRITGARR